VIEPFNLLLSVVIVTLTRETVTAAHMTVTFTATSGGDESKFRRIVIGKNWRQKLYYPDLNSTMFNDVY